MANGFIENVIVAGLILVALTYTVRRLVRAFNRPTRCQCSGCPRCSASPAPKSPETEPPETEPPETQNLIALTTASRKS